LTLTQLAQNRPATAVLRPGYPAPDFAFTDLDGHAGRLSDYRGRVVLVDFWTTHCGPCLESLPRLLASYAKYHGSGFEIVGIDGEDSAETLRPFLVEHKIPWMQTNQEKYDGPLHTEFRFEAWPTYYLVGKDGVIVARSTGSDAFLSGLPTLLQASRKD
jgi:thiol-disulfide isomerase/thioredoxin